MAPSSLIFDCDGVLVNSEVINLAVERKHLAQIGLEYSTEDYISRFVGLSDTAFIQSLKRDYQALGKGPWPERIVSAIRDECLQIFETALVAIEGLVALLAKVSNPIAVASSSQLELLHKKLHLTGLHKHFAPHIYSSEQVNEGKPAPDLFLHAAEQLERQPAHCIVIEDSVNGVWAGVAAGMEVWGFTGGGHGGDELEGQLREAGAHRVFGTYADMSAIAGRF
jgi:HAD superfamily hydrolase (TIGR01509 family)